MAIDINSLPLSMQRQALKKMAAQMDKGGGRSALPTPAPAPKVKGSKYCNVKTTVGQIMFDSKKEAARYGELLLLLKGGIIRRLKLQSNFTLQEGYTTAEGQRIRPIVYKADFDYELWTDSGGVFHWEQVVEDVKSTPTRTKTYLMKKKMLRDKFEIDIREV
ncbi:MAG: DUF1064 domain-containing protein [Oscillospiraceae bacterium]